MPGNVRKIALRLTNPAQQQLVLQPPHTAAPHQAANTEHRGKEEQMLDFPSCVHDLKGTEANFRPALRVSDPEAVHMFPEPRAAGAGSDWSSSSGRDRGCVASP